MTRCDEVPIALMMEIASGVETDKELDFKLMHRSKSGTLRHGIKININNIY